MRLLPVEQQDSRLWHVTNAGLRQAILRGATRPFSRNVVVNEYPKSGGSWLCQMLAEALSLPFPRNRLPMIRSCLMQTHTLTPWNIRQPVIVWRDGRDVMVSLYHHVLIGHERTSPQRLAGYRRAFGIDDPQDVAGNMARFVERMLTAPVLPRFSWPAFVEIWHGRPGAVETRYEDMLADAAGELARITAALGREVPELARLDAIAERYSFRAQSGRAPGTEQTGKYLRKGVAGDWRTCFDAEAREIFDHHAGEALAALGYQRDTC